MLRLIDLEGIIGWRWAGDYTGLSRFTKIKLHSSADCTGGEFVFAWKERTIVH